MATDANQTQQSQASGAGVGPAAAASADAGNPAGANGGGANGSGAGTGANSSSPNGAGTGAGADQGNSNDWAKARGWLNDDGSFKTDELAKGYRNLEGEYSKRVSLPDDKSKPEDVEKFWSTLGKPKTAAEYKLDKPADFKLPYDEKISEAWKGSFHKANVTQTQANVLHEEALKMQQADVAAFAEGVEQRAKAVQPEFVKAWGAVGSETFTKNNEAAIRALRQDPNLKGMEEDLRANGFLSKDGLFTSLWVGHLLAERGKSANLSDTVINPAHGANNADVRGNPFVRFMPDGTTENPDFNMTKGAQLKKSDPSRARQLWIAAGRDEADFDRN